MAVFLDVARQQANVGPVVCDRWLHSESHTCIWDCDGLIIEFSIAHVLTRSYSQGLNVKEYHSIYGSTTFLDSAFLWLACACIGSRSVSCLYSCEVNIRCVIVKICACVHVLGGCIVISEYYMVHTYMYIVMYVDVLGGCIVEACEHVHFPYMIG